MSKQNNDKTATDSDLSMSAGSVPHLWRVSDSKRWTRQLNGKYTMDSSRMAEAWEYTFGELMKTSGFTTQNPKPTQSDEQPTKSMSNDTKKPAASDLSAAICSVELAAVKVGFLVRDENLDIDDFGDALMADVKGDKYEANEWGYQVNGVYCVVEFENVPSPELVETVRQEIYALLSQNIEGSDE